MLCYSINKIYWNELKACLKRMKKIRKTKLIAICKKTVGEKKVIKMFSNMS